RRLWLFERHDVEDAVPNIVREVTGLDLDWPDDDVGVLSPEDQQILTEVAQEYDLPPLILRKLLSVQVQYQGMMRRSGVFNRIREVLDEDWDLADDRSAVTTGQTELDAKED